MAPMCLSAEDHEPRDPMLHYLGCLEFSKRNVYFPQLSPAQQKQVDSELRRIEYLRRVLRKDTVESCLVTNLEGSMDRWRRSRLYTSEDGIKAVRTWRSRKGLANNRSQNNPVQTGQSQDHVEDYDPDVDTNAYLTRFENSKPVEDLNDDRFDGHFPNHKISVAHLLDDKKPSPLTRAPPILSTEANPERVISYFHLPANNMIVSLLSSENNPFQYCPP